MKIELKYVLFNNVLLSFARINPQRFISAFSYVTVKLIAHVFNKNRRIDRYLTKNDYFFWDIHIMSIVEMISF